MNKLSSNNKQDLLKICGSMEQLAGVRCVEYQDGRAGGLRCAMVHNGPLEYALMLDKCLDPAWFRYKGINLSFLSKPGLQGRNPYDTAGEEAIRSIMGGAMFTCGFENIHGHQMIDGIDYPTHGRMRTTPADKVGMDAYFEQDDYKIRVSGEMREARLFGENLVLRRTVETVYGSNEIRFTDVIENQGFEPQPLCFLYHCNAGFPFLAPGTRLILPEISCTPRDREAALGMDSRKVMQAPADGEPEQVFQYQLAAGQDGSTFGAIVNDELKLALSIHWNVRQIPSMVQWKSGASGDYALAIEPTNCGFGGRSGASQTLAPFEQHINEIRFCIAEGDEAIAALEESCRQLLANNDSGEVNKHV